MTTLKTDLLAVWQRVTVALAQLSEDEINKLLDDSYSIEIKLVRKRNKDESPTISTSIDIPAIVSKLSGLSSREDANNFLETNFGSRKFLEPIARHLDIPIMRQDKVETLRDKIIEVTVGAKIRSQAIQGG